MAQPRDWYRFNVLQRNHLNYMENINWATTAVLAAGVVNPNYGVGVGLSYILGRLLYAMFYQKKGGAMNKLRISGMVVCQLSCLVGLGIFVKNYFF